MSNNTCYSFQNSGSCKFGDSCKFSHSANGGGDRTSGGDRDNYSGGNSLGAAWQFRKSKNSNFSSRPAQKCYEFEESGSCRYGDNCKFGHGGQAPPARSNYNSSRGTCYEFQESGSCRYGDECRFSHSAGGNNSGRNDRGNNRSRGVCYKFESGNCDYGDNCRFSHDSTNNNNDGQPKSSNDDAKSPLSNSNAME